MSSSIGLVFHWKACSMEVCLLLVGYVLWAKCQSIFLKGGCAGYVVGCAGYVVDCAGYVVGCAGYVVGGWGKIENKAKLSPAKAGARAELGND